MTHEAVFLVLGAGLAGCMTALELARQGQRVHLVDRLPRPMLGASRHNEGKLHLGYVYAADPVGRTREILSEGSLRFLSLLEDVADIPRDAHLVSDAFTYVVPDGSQRCVEDLASHVAAVDRTAARLCGALGLPGLPESRALGREALGLRFSGRVKAAFLTPEIAVDPARVSDLVASRVLAHPGITFVGGAEVVEVAPRKGGGHAVWVQRGAARELIHGACVINALWEDRLRIDAMAGHQSQTAWAQRWKATLTIDVAPGAVDLPSTTGFVGPFGDVVIYGKRRIYVSWYPALRLSVSTDAHPDATRRAIAAFDQDELRKAALAGMAGLVPGVAGLDRFRDATRIGGGFIMAVGDSDIDDPGSVLHQRHQIGVEEHDGWISLSTGKFCTAPLFGVRAARAALAQEGAGCLTMSPA